MGMRKRGDLAIRLPEFNVVAVYKLLGIFFGRIVVGADKLNGSFELAVFPMEARYSGMMHLPNSP